MDNLLNSLNITPEAERNAVSGVQVNQTVSSEPNPVDIIRNKWKKLGYVDSFDRGILLGGMNQNDSTVKEFFSKLSTALITVAKDETKSKDSQRLYDLVKSVMMLFMEEFENGDKHINAKLFASMHGFISGYMDHIKQDI